MNRTREERAEEEPQSVGVDHFIVSARSASFFVSTEMATHIEACLDARRPRKWIRFVDLSGSRVRLRRREIEYVFQSTSEQRIAYREYQRALNRETRADRDWSDGDC